ncbi:MAG: AtpZ/AtpI family protein [Bradymonadia bacterium]
MGERPEHERLDRKVNRAYKGARYASVGIEFGVSVVIGYLAGSWLEGKFDFAPWGTIIGVIIGFAAGLKSLIQVSMSIMRDAEREAAEREGALNTEYNGPEQHDPKE